MNSFPVPKKNIPSIILAPMEGLTDFPMRALLTEVGGYDFCVSEFLRVSHEVVPSHVIKRHLPEIAHNCRTLSDTPVQLQLLGGDPERLARTAENAVALGVQAIDLNFGCPAKTVNRHDGGATLLKFPDRIREIVKTLRYALPSEIPVSAKLRLGWDDPSAIYLNVERAIEGGASWITIHGRTKMQGYTPPAFWEPIGELEEDSKVPVIANGEIWTIHDLRRCREVTGCSSFMLGRGAVADPSLAMQVLSELRENESVRSSDKVDTNLFFRFIQICLETGMGERYVVGRLKQWLRLVARHESTLFNEIKRLSCLEDIITMLRRSSLHQRDQLPSFL